jgi:outer membrane protein assembly factor BamB
MSDITSQVPLHSPQPDRQTSTAITSSVPAQKDSPLAQPRLRLWPGVLIVVLQWLAIKVPGLVSPGSFVQFLAMFWTPIVAMTAIAIWWLFFSRLRWSDRFLGILACAAIAAGAYFLAHPSISFYGYGLIIYGIPLATTAWVVWLLLTPFLSWPIRRVGLIIALLAAWGYLTLLRLDGIYGGMEAELSWRWSPTAEEKFLAEWAGRPHRDSASPAESPVLHKGDWPGFRGPERDGKLVDVRIATDWKENSPRQVWRHRIGPGWSSFAVVGTRLYTQEQRGGDEVVVCYHTDTGEQLWSHTDSARFTEIVAGPGPRATPTFYQDKIYALGAAGRLNCLEAATGKVVWSRDIAADSKVKVPQWGFSSSPLVAQGIVTVFAGAENKSVLGYNAVSGEPVWSAGEGKLSYCSPHLARLGGIEQVLITTDQGLTAFDPPTGKVLWRHDWPVDQMARIVQPTLISDTDVLIGTGMGKGTQRVHVKHEGASWTDKEVWTSKKISPYYNDMVVYKDHLYGFDGIFFTCIGLDDGESRWRVRGYGNGQVLLLADQGLLLILSEKGEVALVEANPEKHTELGRFQAIEGKTWNHPVIAHGKLFVRNGEEAACFQLTEKSTAAP